MFNRVSLEMDFTEDQQHSFKNFNITNLGHDSEDRKELNSKQIDQIRSGKSLKDPDTKLQLVDYYDNLDEPERIALYKFLVSISKLLTKDVEGDAIPALDQGKGKVVTKGKTKVGAPDPNKKKIARSTKMAAKKQQKKVDKSSPDSEFTPPIKVGESQDKRDVLIEMLNSIV